MADAWLLLRFGDWLSWLGLAVPSKSTKSKNSVQAPSVEGDVVWFWAAGPLVRWNQHFDSWRKGSVTFFCAHDKEPLRRTHLGWVCQLIAEGQQLAVELTSSKRSARQKERLKKLDNFVENLRLTFLVWHAPETTKQDKNPLAKYFG